MEKKKTTTKKKTTKKSVKENVLSKLEKIVNETGKEITFEISEDGKKLHIKDVKKSWSESFDLVLWIILFVMNIVLFVTYTN